MKKEYIKIILDFAEGRISAENFWNYFQNNLEFKETIIEDLIKNKLPDSCFDAVEFLNEGINLLSYSDTANLHGIAEVILQNNNIACNPTNFYDLRFDFLLNIQPNWLDITDENEEFLIDIVDSAPKDLSEAQKLKWCKEKIKELFKYEKSPPRWVQSAEWPIVNGKPLIFKEQSKERKESELVKFFFYNPETEEEVVIRQYF